MSEQKWECMSRLNKRGIASGGILCFLCFGLYAHFPWLPWGPNVESVIMAAWEERSGMWHFCVRRKTHHVNLTCKLYLLNTPPISLPSTVVNSCHLCGPVLPTAQHLGFPIRSSRCLGSSLSIMVHIDLCSIPPRELWPDQPILKYCSCHRLLISPALFSLSLSLHLYKISILYLLVCS